jgi:glycosyltransferase involved in cell wall biosynthesis
MLGSLRPLTITHVDTEMAWRGGQQSLLTLVRGLRERGHKQTIVTPARSALAAEALAQGFTIATKVPREGDIVHAHSGKAQNLAVRATLGSNIIRVITRHVAFEPRNQFFHWLKYAKSANGVIAVSDAVRDGLIRSGVPSDHIQVIHTGVAIPAEIHHTEHEGFTVGHMGAFTDEKGQRVLVEAAGLVPQAKFLLAGEGPLREALMKEAPSNVEFPGFVADLDQFFASLDLFVMPSLSEAWGLAALEAMARGVPVIASDIQGLKEFVDWLVPPNDPAGLARAIESAIHKPLHELGAAARTRASQFSIAKMVDETEGFYARLLTEPRLPATP